MPQNLPADHPAKSKFENSNLSALRIETSLAFWRDKARAFYDPAAPSVKIRMQAIRTLRQAGIPVVLRIDPLLPPAELLHGKSYEDFGLPTPQTKQDLEEIVKFAADVNAMHIVYSAARIIQPRFKPMQQSMQNLKRVYEHISQPEKLTFRGGSFRLPENIVKQKIFQPFVELCKSYNISALHCPQNLISTP